jgi:hypothetical protein
MVQIEERMALRDQPPNPRDLPLVPARRPGHLRQDDEHLLARFVDEPILKDTALAEGDRALGEGDMARES